MTRRRIATELPPKTRGMGRETYKWDDAALEAKKLHDEDPDMWVKAGTAVPVKNINALRLYTGKPFVTDEGRIEVVMRNSAVGKDGIRRGDCYIRWVPEKKESIA